MPPVVQPDPENAEPLVEIDLSARTVSGAVSWSNPDDPNIVTPEPVRNTSIRAFSGSRVEYIQWLKEQVQNLTPEEKKEVIKDN